MANLIEKLTRRLALFIEATIIFVLLIGAAGIWFYRANRLEKDPKDIQALFDTQLRTPHGTAYWKEGNSSVSLVFVPGMFATKEMFDRVRPYLGQAFTVYALDLAGFGYTPTTAAAPGLEGWREQLRQFLADLGIERPVLIGQGEGADVVQAFGAMYPNQVRSLVLIGHEPFTPQRQLASEPTVGRAFLGSKLSPLLMPPVSGRVLVKSVLGKMVSAPDQLTREHIEKLAYPLNRPDFWEEASQVVANYRPVSVTPKVPLDVVYGINDSWSPLEPAKQACETLPSCRFHFLMDSGHLPPLEQPLAFSKLMADLFLP